MKLEGRVYQSVPGGLWEAVITDCTYAFISPVGIRGDFHSKADAEAWLRARAAELREGFEMKQALWRHQEATTERYEL